MTRRTVKNEDYSGNTLKLLAMITIAGIGRSPNCRGLQKRKSLPREEVRQAFRKEPNSDWEEECRRSYRRPWEEEWAV
jgi:hypothetical protein